MCTELLQITRPAALEGIGTSSKCRSQIQSSISNSIRQEKTALPVSWATFRMTHADYSLPLASALLCLTTTRHHEVPQMLTPQILSAGAGLYFYGTANSMVASPSIPVHVEVETPLSALSHTRC